MAQIIGICGLIGSGKDTVADYLIQNYGFKRDAFAATLKDAAAAIFGWDRAMVDGLTKESRAWREQVDTWWSERLDIPELTPRWVLQQWGTELFRTHFHADIWVACIENKLRKTTQNVVITDCRFPNEIAAIKKAGGTVIRVVRGETPSWIPIAETAMRPQWDFNLYQGGGSPSGIALQRLKALNIHASEYSHIGAPFDRIIDNNGTLEELYATIKNLVAHQQVATAA